MSDAFLDRSDRLCPKLTNDKMPVITGPASEGDCLVPFLSQSDDCWESDREIEDKTTTTKKSGNNKPKRRDVEQSLIENNASRKIGDDLGSYHKMGSQSTQSNKNSSRTTGAHFSSFPTTIRLWVLVNSTNVMFARFALVEQINTRSTTSLNVFQKERLSKAFDNLVRKVYCSSCVVQDQCGVSWSRKLKKTKERLSLNLKRFLESFIKVTSIFTQSNTVPSFVEPFDKE